jgi:RNA polymerase sigma factor (TIGR02999 family)
VSDVTRILEAAQQGNPTATDQLRPLVDEELRRLAADKMANEATGHPLHPTVLVHETWLRRVGNEHQKGDGRRQFFAAAEAMRPILIDRARRKRAVRHGGGQQRGDLRGVDPAAPTDDDQHLAVGDAPDNLSAEHKVEAELVKLPCFVGMTIDGAADVLGLSPAHGQVLLDPHPRVAVSSNREAQNLSSS